MATNKEEFEMKLALATFVAVIVLTLGLTAPAYGATAPGCSQAGNLIDEVACYAANDGKFETCPGEETTRQHIANTLGSMLTDKEPSANCGIMSITVGNKTSKGVWVLMPWTRDDGKLAWFMNVRGTEGGFFYENEAPKPISIPKQGRDVVYRPAPPKSPVHTQGLLPAAEFTDPENRDFQLSVGRWHVALMGAKSRNISSAETEILETLKLRFAAYAKKHQTKVSISMERCGEAELKPAATANK